MELTLGRFTLSFKSKKNKRKSRHSDIEDRDAEIMSLLRKMNASEISRKMGISRQRIEQIIKANGGYPKDAVRHKSSERVEIETRYAHMLGKLPDKDLAKYLGVKPSLVSRARNELGIPRYIKPIGCFDCDVDEYARGLCRNCYRLARHRGALDKYHRDHDGTDRRFA